MIKNSIVMTMAALILACPLVASVTDHNHEAQTGGHAEHHEGHIEWTPELLSEFGIETAVVTEGTVQKIRELPGELEFHLDYLAHVTSRYSGVVKKIYKHVGDSVKKGDTLAILESNDSLTNYRIKAPLTGVIYEKHLTLGESIPDSTEIFKIANPSRLWVRFHVYSDMPASISRGTSIVVRNEKGDKLSSKVDFVSPNLSKQTRTRTAIASLRSKGSNWSAGMFVTVHAPLTHIKRDIVIPKTALQKLNEEWVVFIKNGTEIEPQEVIIGEEDSENVEIKEGLLKNQTIITTGSFILKSELQKESFGDGHGH